MKSIVIIGGGGHAKVLIEMMQQFYPEVEILGFTDQNKNIQSSILGIPYIGNDDYLVENFSPRNLALVNGIGSISRPLLRKQIFETFKCHEYSFMTLVHPKAIVATNTSLGEGVQIMAGAIIQADTILGDNTIINTGAIIDHNCSIGSHTHIAPGTAISGGVVVEDTVHIGTGATVIQGVTVGHNSLVAAGAVVIENIKSNTVVMGVPAQVKP